MKEAHCFFDLVILNPHLRVCRDLADNWNVDIASQLEDYMDELASIVVSFDGGVTNVNFAEGFLKSMSGTLLLACIHAHCVRLFSCSVDPRVHFGVLQKGGISVSPRESNSDLPCESKVRMCGMNQPALLPSLLSPSIPPCVCVCVRVCEGETTKKMEEQQVERRILKMRTAS